MKEKKYKLKHYPKSYQGDQRQYHFMIYNC